MGKFGLSDWGGGTGVSVLSKIDYFTRAVHILRQPNWGFVDLQYIGTFCENIDIDKMYVRKL